MKIEFSKMEEKAVAKFKEGEGIFHVKLQEDNLQKIMQGRLEPGASIGMHTHETNSEIIYILQGKGKALYDGGEERLSAGDCHYCPKGHTHSLINDSNENLIFFAVVPEQ